jgi:hypothetical protein
VIGYDKNSGSFDPRPNVLTCHSITDLHISATGTYTVYVLAPPVPIPYTCYLFSLEKGLESAKKL